jgi:hypothetical protein
MPFWLEVLLWVVGLNWGLPLLTWSYVLVVWLWFRDVSLVGWFRGIPKFRLLGDERVWWNDSMHPGQQGEFEIVGLNGKAYVIRGLDGSEHTVFSTELDFMEPWHSRLWVDWGGVGLYGYMVYRDRPLAWDDKWVARTVTHEWVHVVQFLSLGLLHFLLYAGHVGFIYLFQKNKHPYLDCWAERMARSVAGQKVNYTQEEWPQGPRDRWPW